MTYMVEYAFTTLSLNRFTVVVAYTWDKIFYFTFFLVEASNNSFNKVFS